MTAHTRGTGCTLASAFATTLALGYQKEDALCLARAYLQQALRRGYATGQGAGSLGVGSWPTEQVDFPS
jgi:hydroxymethylpyrimidine kinase/phosphomethylpyrimidine kinase/thiamine-phosphate diphosphorylase